MHILFEIKNLQNVIARNIFNDVPLNKFKTPPSMIQVEVIFHLLQNKEREVYQKDLETIFKLRRSTISGVLKTLEKRGVIKRIDSKTDARVKRIIITKEAEDLYVKGLEWMEKIEKKATKGIEKEKLEIFLKVLEQMKNNIEENNEEVRELK